MSWIPRRALAIVATAAFFIAATPAAATLYEVGPGFPLASIGAVPWASLQPGDVVQIHWRADPYREKWVIGRSGTLEAPIVVRGVLGPSGERPVISGDGATTPAPLDFTGEARGLLKIGTSNVPAETLPSYLVVENLELRSAYPAYGFTDDHGVAQVYAQNAAALYVERAQHLVIRNCVLTDSGNGLFVGAFDGDTRDITIEGNWIYGNGNDGSAYEHNTYTAAIGIVYQYNRFGPLRAGSIGNNLKDRSAGLVVRDNWIEGGNRQLDLVDGEDTNVIVEDPSYHETFVYGNVLIEPDGAGNSQIVHYGGDSGNEAIYRKGWLYFYENTVVSNRVGNTTLLRLSTDAESADVRNNVLYVAATGDRLGMLDDTGTLDLGHNWIKPGWVQSHSGAAAVFDDGTNVETASPGFADEASQNYRPAAGSPLIDAAGPLNPAVLPDHPVTREYVEHQSSRLRADDAVPDIGAFGSCVVSCPEPASGAALLVAIASVGSLARFSAGAGSRSQPTRSRRGSLRAAANTEASPDRSRTDAPCRGTRPAHARRDRR